MGTFDDAAAQADRIREYRDREAAVEAQRISEAAVVLDRLIGEFAEFAVEKKLPTECLLQKSGLLGRRVVRGWPVRVHHHSDEWDSSTYFVLPDGSSVYVRREAGALRGQSGPGWHWLPRDGTPRVYPPEVIESCFRDEAARLLSL